MANESDSAQLYAQICLNDAQVIGRKMTKDEQIEQLEMEKRLLIRQLVKVQNWLRNFADANCPGQEDLQAQAKELYLELRG